MARNSNLERFVDAPIYSTLLMWMHHAHAAWARPGEIEGYINQIENAPKTHSLMVIGHNPLMEDMLSAYLRLGATGFGNNFSCPRTGIAILGFLHEIAEGQGELVDFLTP